MKHSFCILMICFISFSRLYAQQVINKEDVIRDALEYAASEDQDFDYSGMAYWLDYYYDHPIRINHTSANELALIQFLSPLQIYNLLDYQKQYGDILSVYELQAIPGFDVGTIRLLLPFITIDSKEKINLSSSRLKTTLTASHTLEKQVGYSPQLTNGYVGSPYGLQMKVDYRVGSKIDIGMVADKDEGEQFFKGTQKQGFDFYSAHIFYKSSGILKNIAVGDYQFQAGQGLVLWNSFRFNKTPNVLNTAVMPAGLLPSHSSSSAFFFRGVAATLQIKKWQVAFLTSFKNMDANVLTDTFSTQEDLISTISLSGYHRTPREIGMKNALTSKMGGISIKHVGNSFQYEFAALTGNNSLPSNAGNTPYQRFRSIPQKFSNAALSYQYHYSNLFLFGEAATDGYYPALLQGALFALHPNVDIGVIARKYGKGYYAPFGNAFGEASSIQNESGTYLTVNYRPATYLKFAAFADFFRFPWLRYRVDAPSYGQDYSLNMEYQPSKILKSSIKYHQKIKSINVHDISNLNYVLPGNLSHLRFEVVLESSKILQFNTRLELSSYELNNKKSFGYLAYQEMTCRLPKQKIKITARYSVFDIDDYNARIYAYEDNVRGAFSIPAFQHKGIRYFILTNYRINSNFSIAVRYAQTIYTDIESTGTGNSFIASPHRSDVLLQLLSNY